MCLHETLESPYLGKGSHWRSEWICDSLSLPSGQIVVLFIKPGLQIDHGNDAQLFYYGIQYSRSDNLPVIEFLEANKLQAEELP